MIELFQLPQPKIDISAQDHLLHGSVVTRFENEFAEYVGAKYAVGVCSCTMAITIVASYYQEKTSGVFAELPVMVPPVVYNAVYHSGIPHVFTDIPKWVGGPYYLIPGRVVDSAQDVRSVPDLFEDNQMSVLYSFYPTKPVGGIDGGMICTNNKDIYDWCCCAVMNGVEYSKNSWDRKYKFPGWKAYMSTAQAIVAQGSMDTLGQRKGRLSFLRDYYNREFGLTNISDHLYRVSVLPEKRQSFLKSYVHQHGFRCGIHYNTIDRACGVNVGIGTQESCAVADSTVSIPFHPGVSQENAEHIVKTISRYIKR